MKYPLIFIVVLALFAGLAAFFYTRSAKQPQRPPGPTPTPYALPTVNSWNGIVPGSSTTQDLATKLGNLSAGAQSGTITTYSFPSTNQYWKNEVDVENDAVTFVRERIFPPANVSLKSLTANLTEKSVVLYGPDHASGTLLYVYPASGIAYLANSFRDTVYQVWRFPSTPIDKFLTLPQAAGYGLAPAGQPEGI